MPILNITHFEQRQFADCLAACSVMVLDYLGIQIRYRRLLRLLQVSDDGASFYQLERLRDLGVNVQVADGHMDVLEENVAIGLPIIASVVTQDLLYWSPPPMNHAILVIGIDAQSSPAQRPRLP